MFKGLFFVALTGQFSNHFIGDLKKINIDVGI
ncbi:hypothetical protein C8C85_2630 [Flavobacterium sp. 103]|nr:hypothetical protein C8C85_2630 [Flavobacterium sp. 103]